MSRRLRPGSLFDELNDENDQQNQNGHADQQPENSHWTHHWCSYTLESRHSSADARSPIRRTATDDSRWRTAFCNAASNAFWLSSLVGRCLKELNTPVRPGSG